MKALNVIGQVGFLIGTIALVIALVRKEQAYNGKITF
ncbi:MAG: hypothetical protein K0S56_564 [Microvirga sp.]|jgi:hypothetical protein|nr:hypothetical protein [Microvirga sp.]